MTSTGGNVLIFLVDTIFTLYISVVIGRVLLQATRAPFHNPIAQFVWRVTATPVRYVGMIVPRWRHIDIPAAIFAVLLSMANIEIDALIMAGGLLTNIATLLWIGLIKTLLLVSNLYFFTILAQAILSWVAPGRHTPATALLYPLNEPLLKPVRRVLPTIGGLDLSPLVVIIALQAINIVLNQQVMYFL